MNWFVSLKDNGAIYRRSGPSLEDFMKDKDGKIPFETTEELLKLQSVKRWKGNLNFSHFAISKNCLMVILKDGFGWWVIGYIGNPELVNLPKWDGGKYKVQFDDGTITILTSNDLSYSCLNIAVLKDGRRAVILK